MFSITPMSFDALSPMNPLEYWLKPESLGYIFVADSIDPSSFKFSHWAAKDAPRTCFETALHNKLITLQGQPRSLILAPIESAYWRI